MPVSGIVIQIDPDKRAEVLVALEALPQVEIEPVPEGGVLVAVLDTKDFEQENELVKVINELFGVNNVTLSYHNFEDMTDSGVTQ